MSTYIFLWSKKGKAEKQKSRGHLLQKPRRARYFLIQLRRAQLYYISFFELNSLSLALNCMWDFLVSDLASKKVSLYLIIYFQVVDQRESFSFNCIFHEIMNYATYFHLLIKIPETNFFYTWGHCEIFFREYSHIFRSHMHVFACLSVPLWIIVLTM